MLGNIEIDLTISPEDYLHTVLKLILYAILFGNGTAQKYFYSLDPMPKHMERHPNPRDTLRSY